MKVRILLVFALSAALIIIGCSKKAISPQFDSDDQVQDAIDKAGVKTTEVVNLAIKASFNGDPSELLEYLDTEDTDGVVKRLLEENGIDLKAQLGKTFDGLDLPGFDSSVFEDGSALLSRTVGSPTSDLIAWILPGIYTHTGMLNQELYTGPDAGCVITANLDGVTYETYNDWNGATTVTKLNVDADYVEWPHPNLDYFQNRFINFYQGWTLYAFLRLNLEAIPRTSHLFWYCSKTTWKVFSTMDIDVENATWYDNKLEILRTSGLYQIYRAFLMLFLPEDVATALADAKIMRVVGELITPDEVRFATSDQPDGTEGGALDPNSTETWGIPEP